MVFLRFARTVALARLGSLLIDGPPSWLGPDYGVARGNIPVRLSTDNCLDGGWCAYAFAVALEFVVGEIPTKTGGYVGLDLLPGIPPRAAWVLLGTYDPLLTPRWGWLAIWNRSPLAGLGQKLPSGHGLCTHRDGAHRTRRATGSHVSPL